jgi:hypothetical protein
MATTLNLANQHIQLLKSDNEELKLKKSKLDSKVRSYEHAENERRFQTMRDEKDSAIESAKEEASGAIEESQTKLQALEQKLNAANMKLNQKQMLKLGDDE